MMAKETKAETNGAKPSTFINSNQDLRKGLAEVWADLRSGKIKPKDAAEFSNMAGKFINSAKLDIEYIRLCQTTPQAKQAKQIKFLTDSK